MGKIKRTGMMFLVVGIISYGSYALAQMDMNHNHGQMMKSEAKEVKSATIKGEIVELACYLEHGEKGSQHAQCAVACFEQGIPVALLDAKGNLYTLVGKDMKPTSEFVKKEHLGVPVKVTGNSIQKGGSNFLIIEKVSLVPPTKPAQKR